MAKFSVVGEVQGDGWLSSGRLVAKLIVRWVAKLVERWLAKLVGRRVAKLVAHLLATAALWVRIQTSPKNTIWTT